MLSHTLEYALRAVAFLAGTRDRAHTAREIADATSVPSGYLAKVLGQLARAGVIRSQRGLGGGFVLTRPPEEVSILEVARAVDPVKRIERCPLDLPEHARSLCALHQRLDEALATIEGSFRASSVADLVAAPARRGDPPAWPVTRVAAAARKKSRRTR